MILLLSVYLRFQTYTSISRFFLLLGICFLSLNAKAQSNYRFSGQVTDDMGQPLAFASVNVDEARWGTLNQTNGFSLQLPAGSHVVTISYLGYQSIKDTIFLRGNLTKNYQLTPETVFLEEVIITEDGRDPAYYIMKKAIERKKENAVPFPQYAYDAYNKSILRFQEGFDLDSMLKSFAAGLGSLGGADNEEEEAETAGLPSDLLYLSESFSRMYIKAPQLAKEEILSSRVSGASDQFSFLGNLFNRFDPYENRSFLGQIAERGIVSPLSGQAFLFYRFKLLGSLIQEGEKVYKIQVIRKRKQDPAFSGLIYIADSSFAVQNLDLYVTKEQAIQVLDSIRVSQSYQKFHRTWVPMSTQMRFALNFKVMVLTLPLVGQFTSVLSQYEEKAELPKAYFKREIIRVDDSALVHPPVWWDSVRPLPLTEIERTDYRVKDSLEQVTNSPEYLDSLTASQPKVNAQTLLLGGVRRDFRKKTSWVFVPLWDQVGFNAIEGFYLGQGIDRIWERPKDRSWRLGYRLHGGLSSRLLSYQGQARYKGGSRYNLAVEAKGGDFVQQFNPVRPIGPWATSGQALYFKQSFIRLYRKQFGGLSYEQDIANGLQLEVTTEFSRRLPMSNSSDYTLFPKDEPYTPNLRDTLNRAWVSTIGLRYQPFNRYISIPGGRMSMGSKWPVFSLLFSYALPFADGEVADFQKIEVRVEDEVSLGLVGTFNWMVKGGQFLAAEKVYTPDLFHFHGNRTYFLRGGWQAFSLLPYYDLSSTSTFLEAHARHDFGGFLFNKIPGIRRLKLSEYAEAHFLLQENGTPYLELDFGFSKRFFKFIPLTIEGNVRLLEEGIDGPSWGFKIGITNLEGISASLGS
ncbi:MAG: DUF5686 and carboxypeptidase regulatory-like domain-containing protein [Bacteroidota bacterium]